MTMTSNNVPALTGSAADCESAAEADGRWSRGAVNCNGEDSRCNCSEAAFVDAFVGCGVAEDGSVGFADAVFATESDRTDECLLIEVRARTLSAARGRPGVASRL